MLFAIFHNAVTVMKHQDAIFVIKSLNIRIMKEKDLRKEAYKESKKSQRKETVIVFAVIAGAGALFWCALIPINFWFGCGLGLFLIAVACFFAHATWKRHQTELHAVAQGILTEAEVVELKDEKDSDGKLTNNGRL